MRKVFLALIGATALSIAPAAYADVSIDFSNPSGPLGDDQDYTANGLTVTASGYTTKDVDENLYGKNLGGNENGLGLITDSQHEIYGPDAFIQLDVSQILGLATGADFFMNSTTSGEQWSVWGNDIDAAGKVGGTLLLTGSDQGSSALHALPGWGLYDFYNFFAVGANDNVLLGGLTIHEAVPEPATWAMMLLGFGAIGVAFRRRRPKDLAQLA